MQFFPDILKLCQKFNFSKELYILRAYFCNKDYHYVFTQIRLRLSVEKKVRCVYSKGRNVKTKTKFRLNV